MKRQRLNAGRTKSVARADPMITNVIDRRKRPYRFFKVNAIVEAALHDNFRSLARCPLLFPIVLQSSDVFVDGCSL